MITPFEDTLATALHILRSETAVHNTSPSVSTTTSKTIVFFPTARHVGLAHAVLAAAGKTSLPSVQEIHSRKSQSARTKTADSFRDATAGVLLCSDVVARGMDFPGYALLSPCSPSMPPLTYIY